MVWNAVLEDIIFQALHTFKISAHPELILPPSLAQAVSKRQRDFLAGRYCAYQRYQALGMTWDHLPVTASGAPAWPSGFCGSITHSKSLAAAVLFSCEQAKAVGIDAEHIMEEDLAQRVSSQILHPDEKHWVNTPEQLTAIFSLKESLYKALNPLLQRFIGFEEVCVFPFSDSLLTLPEHRHRKGLRLDFEPVNALREDFPTGFTRHGYAYVLSEPMLQIFTTYRHPTHNFF